MKNIKGPGIFLAQFVDATPPMNSIEGLCQWAVEKGYFGVQIPTWESTLIDIERLAQDPVFAKEWKQKIASFGVEITELSAHIQGQLIAVHPAYNTQFDAFCPPQYRNNYKERTQWATRQLEWVAKASKNLDLQAAATFSGSLLWPYLYPWPQRSKELVEEGFSALAKRWVPILNEFDRCGVDLCYEIHPAEDLHDGVTFEKFLQVTHNHPRIKILYDPSHLVLQQIDYLQYIDFYHPYIKMFHVKDAEFLKNGKTGLYGGYLDWLSRAGRFRSIGDGEVDFQQVFSKLTQYDYEGWAVLEWECCLKDGEQGAIEGAKKIKEYMIKISEKPFDDFAKSTETPEELKKILGLL